MIRVATQKRIFYPVKEDRNDVMLFDSWDDAVDWYVSNANNPHFKPVSIVNLGEANEF